MKKGHLSSYFQGIAAKTLSAVEIKPTSSHQHEFNGVTQFKTLLGESRQTYPAILVYFGDSESEIFTSECSFTWYDARENHVSRTEHRLYFQTNYAIQQANIGDSLLIALSSTNTIYAFITKPNSTYESQIKFLFGFKEIPQRGSKFKKIEKENDFKLDYSLRYILEELGIEINEDADEYLDTIIQEFGNSFPSTLEFSRFARNNLGYKFNETDPDSLIINFVNHEELLFRTFERYLVSEKIKIGFNDVDDFVKYSLSIQNRRKSRAGHALENHLEFIFQKFHIKYSRGRITEHRSKPDFIFPSINKYHENNFSTNKLTMLGVKSTCKDRWRQVLSEAQKIKHKHLFTLEPSISINQTNEMKANDLQLVIPYSLHATYNTNQQSWLLKLTDFIKEVQKKQK